MIARTIKGKGVKAVENQEGWHGKPLDDPEAAIEELGGLRNIVVEVAQPEPGEAHVFETGPLELPQYEVGSEVATRKAYGEALAAVGTARGDVVAVDGEVSNSTFAEIFKAAHPDRFFEMYIAEQQMAAAAVGLQARGWRVFASSFAAFHSRAYDFVRMAAISPRDALSLRLARGDLDRRGRAVADGARGHRLAARGARLDRAPPVRRQPDREARRGDGGSRRHLATSARCARTRRCCTGRTRSSRSAAAASLREGDEVTIVGCGITVHEALKAADALRGGSRG